MTRWRRWRGRRQTALITKPATTSSCTKGAGKLALEVWLLMLCGTTVGSASPRRLLRRNPKPSSLNLACGLSQTPPPSIVVVWFGIDSYQHRNSNGCRLPMPVDHTCVASAKKDYANSGPHLQFYLNQPRFLFGDIYHTLLECTVPRERLSEKVQKQEAACGKSSAHGIMRFTLVFAFSVPLVSLCNQVSQVFLCFMLATTVSKNGNMVGLTRSDSCKS